MKCGHFTRLAMRTGTQQQAPTRWPVRHTLDLALIVLVLQPTLLFFTLVDFARGGGGDGTFLDRGFAYISRVLRPGKRADNVDADTLVWEAMLSLFGLVLTQAWYCTRMKGWQSIADGLERHEDAHTLKKRRVPIHAQVEVRHGATNAVYRIFFVFSTVIMGPCIGRCCGARRACKYVRYRS